MKKRFSVIFILLAFILTISVLSGFTKNSAFADTTISSLTTQSKSAYLIDANTGTLIYSNNENEKLPIASMCKIMTLLLCFDALESEEISLGEEIVVSEVASGMGGSQVFLETNGKYTVGELIKSIPVASANDACVAMAERLCGSEAEFTLRMNQKAQELNMNNTNFVNCTGLPSAGQYSCAKDVATMFSKLLEHEQYFKFSRIWTDVVKHPNDRVTEISNTNKLIRFYSGCDSGKTGYTNEAGHCLAASAMRNGMRLIAVVIKAPDSKCRFKDVSSMFNYGFANYVNKLIVDDKKPLDITVEICGGKKNTLEVVAEKPLYLFSSRSEKRSVEIDFIPTCKIKAPILKGEVVGELIVYENGTQILSVNVLSNEDVLEKTYFDNIKDVADNWTII